MVKTREIQSAPPWSDTMRALRDCFDDWGIERHDWQVKRLEGEAVEVVFYLPYDAQQHRVVSYGQRYADRNLRACFHHVQAAQRDSLRGVSASYAGVEYLALPAGDPQEAQARQRHQRPRASRAQSGIFKGLRDACDFMGVRETAEEEVVNGAYRALARKHRDEQESMRRLNAARDFIFERRGWAVRVEAVEP